MEEIRDPRFSRGLKENLSLIEAVREAVRTVLEPTGWRDLKWDPAQRAMVVNHFDHGTLPVAALSDGIRNMIALVSDIAHRCARLNPHFGEGAARQTRGVLLIDEIDVHLHPRWQQLAIELLRSAFPSLQIILSTHSPHVLSTVDHKSIRLVGLDGAIETPLVQTRGVLSADVLATIMGVDPIPKIEVATQLARYRALIEDGLTDSSDAKALRAVLALHFGESHPSMIECDRLIRFQAFKLKKQRQEES
jgi:predicted ATP-binding protein involved in virulence